ncbi:F-box protein At5g07610-like [Bidens hawaiensis]|uniref:F-box protein At5g07610-like n=1 Tax=Bidens hawaiensis TaxID=980011 RepID=UPI0040490453
MEDSYHHQSGALIGSNEDLLTEILIRLPVTSVLRFKSVCKHWRLLLTHTHFTHRYDNNNNNNLSQSHGIFAGNIYVPFDVENRSPPPFRSLDSYFNRADVEIVQSCNGLLLCSAAHNGDVEYYVFNPTTKQLAFILSIPGGHKVLKTIHSMALAFHHTHCVKVVCIRYLDSNWRLIHVQVYSSDTRIWKPCIVSFSERLLKFREPVYWNGALHWAPAYQNGGRFLYFKLDVEQLSVLPMPEGLVSKTSVMHFGKSRGHLHLVSRPGEGEDILCVNVYEKLRDHSGWFVKYQLRLDALLGDFPEMIQHIESVDDFGNMISRNKCGFRVVDVVRGKEEEDTFLVLLTQGKVINYNVHDKSFKELHSNKYYSCEFESHLCSASVGTVVTVDACIVGPKNRNFGLLKSS